MNLIKEITDSQRMHFVFFFEDKGVKVVLVVVNFSNEMVDCEVRLPRHLFEYWQMSETTLAATDLLTGRVGDMTLRAGHPIRLQLPALGGVAYKMVLE